MFTFLRPLSRHQGIHLAEYMSRLFKGFRPALGTHSGKRKMGDTDGEKFVVYKKGKLEDENASLSKKKGNKKKEKKNQSKSANQSTITDTFRKTSSASTPSMANSHAPSGVWGHKPGNSGSNTTALAFPTLPSGSGTSKFSEITAGLSTTPAGSQHDTLDNVTDPGHPTPPSDSGTSNFSKITAAFCSESTTPAGPQHNDLNNYSNSSKSQSQAGPTDCQQCEGGQEVKEEQLDNKSLSENQSMEKIQDPSSYMPPGIPGCESGQPPSENKQEADGCSSSCQKSEYHGIKHKVDESESGMYDKKDPSLSHNESELPPHEEDHQALVAGVQWESPVKECEPSPRDISNTKKININRNAVSCPPRDSSLPDVKNDKNPTTDRSREPVRFDWKRTSEGQKRNSDGSRSCDRDKNWRRDTSSNKRSSSSGRDRSHSSGRSNEYKSHDVDPNVGMEASGSQFQGQGARPKDWGYKHHQSHDQQHGHSGGLWRGRGWETQNYHGYNKNNRGRGSHQRQFHNDGWNQGKNFQHGDQSHGNQGQSASKSAKKKNKKVDTAPLTDAESGFELHTKYGDLFDCQTDTSLAHCISADIKMGAGIAVTFKKEFGGTTDLAAQGKGVGEVAILYRQERFIYYLITKEKFHKKPTYDTLTMCLKEMKAHCEKHNVTKLAMPKIGCGLDKLNWPNVEGIIFEVFHDRKMTITIYHI